MRRYLGSLFYTGFKIKNENEYNQGKYKEVTPELPEMTDLPLENPD